MIKRMRYREFFIQSEPARDRIRFFAWSSCHPTTNPITAPGEVFFAFGETENAAIDEIKNDLDKAAGDAQ